MTTENKRMIQLVDSDVNWAASALVPYKGEICCEIISDVDIRFKVGDGTRTYSALPYTNDHLLGTNVVLGFAGRSANDDGQIIPQIDDYSADMITPTGSLIFFSPDERVKLGNLDPARLLPSGGNATDLLARASAEPNTYVWVPKSSGGGSGATRTNELLDWSTTPPTEGQVGTYRTASGKYVPENPSTTAVTRVKKGSPTIMGAIGGLSRQFLASDENKFTIIDLAAGPVALQFDNNISHAVDEILVSSFMTRNYSSIDDYRVSFASLVALSATLPVLAQCVTGSKGSGVGGTAISNGANAMTVTVAAGANITIMLQYAVNPADVAQVTRTSGFEMTTAGGAAVLTPWTNVFANNVLADAPHLCTAEIKLGTLGASTVYTFKPIWVDVDGVTPILTANVNAYELLAFVFTGSDQNQPFENLHPDHSAATSNTVVAKVATDGPGRLCIHTMYKRSNTGNTAITFSAGPTLIVEGTTQAAASSANLRYCATQIAAATESLVPVTFTLPTVNGWGYAPFAVRPAVMAGMVIKITNERSAYVAASDVLITVMYDGNKRLVNISY